jgi:hypothetical protein
MVLISLIFTCIGSISEEITNLQYMQMYVYAAKLKFSVQRVFTSLHLCHFNEYFR